jgi:hypothetical protein
MIGTLIRGAYVSMALWMKLPSFTSVHKKRGRTLCKGLLMLALFLFSSWLFHVEHFVLQPLTHLLLVHQISVLPFHFIALFLDRIVSRMH